MPLNTATHFVYKHNLMVYEGTRFAPLRQREWLSPVLSCGVSPDRQPLEREFHSLTIYVGNECQPAHCWGVDVLSVEPSQYSL